MRKLTSWIAIAATAGVVAAVLAATNGHSGGARLADAPAKAPVSVPARAAGAAGAEGAAGAAPSAAVPGCRLPVPPAGSGEPRRLLYEEECRKLQLDAVPAVTRPANVATAPAPVTGIYPGNDDGYGPNGPDGPVLCEQNGNAFADYDFTGYYVLVFSGALCTSAGVPGDVGIVEYDKWYTEGGQVREQQYVTVPGDGGSTTITSWSGDTLYLTNVAGERFAFDIVSQTLTPA